MKVNPGQMWRLVTDEKWDRIILYHVNIFMKFVFVNFKNSIFIIRIYIKHCVTLWNQSQKICWFY